MHISNAHVISKIKFEIDINNDELLGIVWEHKREILKVRVRGVLLSLEHVLENTSMA
jgi:hypothetical protein